MGFREDEVAGICEVENQEEMKKFWKCAWGSPCVWMSKMTIQKTGRGTMTKERITGELLAEIFPELTADWYHSVIPEKVEKPCSIPQKGCTLIIGFS